LGVYGTKQEKLDRLKKANGIPEPYINDVSSAIAKSNVVENIEKMKLKREERRNKMEELK